MRTRNLDRLLLDSGFARARARAPRNDKSKKPGLIDRAFDCSALARRGLRRFVRHSGIVAVGVGVGIGFAIRTGFGFGLGAAARAFRELAFDFLDRFGL